MRGHVRVFLPRRHAEGARVELAGAEIFADLPLRIERADVRAEQFGMRLHVDDRDEIVVGHRDVDEFRDAVEPRLIRAQRDARRSDLKVDLPIEFLARDHVPAPRHRLPGGHRVALLDFFDGERVISRRPAMRHLELMVDGDRDGLIEDRLLLERLAFEDLPALLEADLRGVADLRAFREVLPRRIPVAAELADEIRIELKTGGGIGRNPIRRDDRVQACSLTIGRSQVAGGLVFARGRERRHVFPERSAFTSRRLLARRVWRSPHWRGRMRRYE